MLFGLFGMSGGLHYIRYYFRHGGGRDRHEREREERIAAQLRGVREDEAEEQEELVRLQLSDQLKNRRLVWYHVTIFVGVVALAQFLNIRWVTWWDISDWSNWQGVTTFTGIWGIGLVAHVLRYVFEYGRPAAGREAKIEAQMARELEREAGRSAARAGRRDGSRPMGDEGERALAVSLEDLEAMQERTSC